MVNKIIHKHSSVITDGQPKIPTENQLEYGELAINYGKGVETISFKNTNNEIVEIKTKNYFDEKILLNSKDINTLEDKVNDIKSTIEGNELVTATAISDLDVRTNDIKLNVENNELITAAAITEINGRINTIQGNDKNTSMRNIASQEIAKVVAEAPDNLNTLKEIADWIVNDTTGSIQMSNDIVELKEIVSGYTSENNIKTDIDSKSDKTHTHDYLPLSGGTMSNDIDMNLHSMIKTGVDIVESLPTENLFNGRQVTYEGKLYTYNNNEWNCIADDLGGKPETHEENFVYQPTASDLSIKDGFADIKKLKGNTLVWNQMIKINTLNSINGFTIEKINNYTFKLNGTLAKGVNASDNSFALLGYNFTKYPFSGLNKIILKLKHISGYASHDKIYLGNGYFNAKKIGKNHLITPLSSAIEAWTSTNFYLQFDNDAITFEDYVFSVQCFDLTQMFGEGNEPATVEDFETMFPNDYEYNEGELMSFDGKGVKSVGFNQWDEEWEVGFINSQGANENRTNAIRSNYIKVLPNTKYYIATTNPAYRANESIRIRFYDNNKNYAGNPGVYTTNKLFTTPDGCCYMRWCTYPTVLPTNSYSKGDICISLSHSGYRNGEYEPYEDYKLSFQDGKTISQLTGKLNGEGESVTIFPEGLRSAGEAFDEIVYDEATGKHKAIKRIGSVDMGILSYMYNTGISIFYTHSFTSIPKIKTGGAVISVKYPQYTGPVSEMLDKRINTSNYHYNNAVIIKDTSYTDVDSFKASLQGQILYYELAEPEVYELDFPINTSYEAYDFGTEEVLYNNDKEVNIPMKANIEYGFNAVDMIRGNYFEVDKIKKGLNEINFLITDLDVRTNDIKSNIESNELVTASAITNLEERIKELEKKINQLLSNN